MFLKVKYDVLTVLCQSSWTCRQYSSCKNKNINNIFYYPKTACMVSETPVIDPDQGTSELESILKKKKKHHPILKNTMLDFSDVNNYRPVSLLSFLSKVLERVAYNQLDSFFSLNKLLDPHWSRFKTAHSTATQRNFTRLDKATCLPF